MSDKTPYFVRDDDGVLIQNPKMSAFDRRSYRAPDEAIKVWYCGELRLGCNHGMFRHYSSQPCGNPPKHDPDANGRPTKCGIHSSAAVAKRKAKSEAKMQAWRDGLEENRKKAAIKSEMLPLIKSIADGHNDARGACVEFLERFYDLFPPQREAGE